MRHDPRDETVITVEDTDETFEQLIEAVEDSEDLYKRLADTNALIVPLKETGYFPSQTHELFVYLKDHAPDNIKVEVYAEEDEYVELSLHADWALIAGIVVADLLAPLIVNLIWEYIQSRRKRRTEQTVIRTEMTVIDSKTGRAKRFKYEGPAADYQDTVLRSLSSNFELLESSTDDD